MTTANCTEAGKYTDFGGQLSVSTANHIILDTFYHSFIHSFAHS